MLKEGGGARPMCAYVMVVAVCLSACGVWGQTFSSFSTMAPPAGCTILGIAGGTPQSSFLYQQNCTSTGFKVSSLFYFDSTNVFTWSPPAALSWGSDGSIMAIKAPNNIYSDTLPTVTWTLDSGNAVAVSIGSSSYGGSGTLWAVVVNSGKVLYQATSALGASTSWLQIATGVYAASVGDDGTLGYIDSTHMIYMCQLRSVSPFGCVSAPVALGLSTSAIGLDIYDASNILSWGSNGNLYFLVNGWHPGNPNTASWEYISAPQFIISSALVSGPAGVLNVPVLGKAIVGYQGTDGVWRSATYAFNCGPGTYGDWSSGCTKCPAGTYSNVIGATTSATCSACSAGTYSSSAGVTVCAACAAGQYGPSTGLTSCPCCNSGGYTSSPGQTTCLDCSTTCGPCTNPDPRGGQCGTNGPSGPQCATSAVACAGTCTGQCC